MYVVVDKKSRRLIHQNPAPLASNLKPEEVYYKFDANTMEIGKTDGKLPGRFEVDKNGNIVPLPGSNPGRQIVQNGPGQQFPGNLNHALLSQSMDARQARPLGDRELYEKEQISLEEYKARRIEYFSRLSFQKRNEILPEYKVLNAALGIYDEKKTEMIKSTILAFKEEFKRVRDMIDGASTAEVVALAEALFPKRLLAAAKKKPGKSGKSAAKKGHKDEQIKKHKKGV